MENMAIHLESFGLTEREIKIYSYPSKYGPTKLSAIVTALGLNRLQTYRILQRLVEKELVEFSMEILGNFVPHLLINF